MINRICLLFFLLVGASSCSNNDVYKLDEQARGKVKKEDKVKDITLTFEPKVDILFVIDNSGSMDKYQQNLARQATSFTNRIAQNILLDYHIGVVTSDMETRAGELIGSPPWVEKNTPNGNQVLAERLHPGSNGDWMEFFFEPLVAALRSPLVNGANKGFYRPEAYLAVVFITDAAIAGPLTGKTTYDFLLSLKQNDKDKLAAYAAIIPHDNPNHCVTDDLWNTNNLNRFLEFLDFFENSGWGKNYFDLCSDDYGKDLARIGKDLENKIEMFIPLKEFPVLETMVVKYGRQVIPQDADYGWSYVAERTGILLGRELKLTKQKGAVLTINYLPAKLEFPNN
ncbi:MAG: VWA domain-containing protein [Bdellovibrionaceae bacterium]|nr:VWA domain-containing protein [Pseudobdellovibrionaceae bacterium]